MKAAKITEIPILTMSNAVLFPRTILPLHLPEARHRQLIIEVVRREVEMGVTLLRPGWETDYYENPEVFLTGGLGVVTEHKDLMDRGAHAVVKGVQRFTILEFLQSRPYRVARVQLLDDFVPESSERRCRQLRRYFREIADAGGLRCPSRKALARLDFHALVNSICASLSLSVYEKQRLLEMEDVRFRGDLVLKILREQVLQVREIARFRHLEPEDSRVN
jgi:Lon protease-like protein